jgi:hypothetical protein
MSGRFCLGLGIILLCSCRAAAPAPKPEVLTSVPPAAFEDWLKAQKEAVERDPQNAKELRRYIAMLVAEGAISDLAKLPKEAVSDYVKTVSELERPGSLKVAKAELCRKISGFRRYVPYGDPKFKPGALLLIYVEFEGFALTPWGDYHTLHLRYDWELLDAQGRKLSLPAWEKASPQEKEDKIEFRGDVRDFHQSFGLPLPKNLPGGAYTLRILAEDQANKKRDEIRLPIEVVFE